MRSLLALCAVLALAGCVTAGEPIPRIDLACDSYSASLRTLAVANASGALSADVESAVDQIVAVVDPICTAPARPTAADVIATVEAHVYDLLLIRKEAAL